MLIKKEEEIARSIKNEEEEDGGGERSDKAEPLIKKNNKIGRSSSISAMRTEHMHAYSTNCSSKPSESPLRAAG